MHALVVDDSRASLLVISNLVRNLGYRVTEATGGREALKALKEKTNFQFILLDWSMPEMDGVEFISRARTNPLCSEVPIIMVSMNDSMDLVQLALEAGASEFIMKPITKEALISKLEILGIGKPVKKA